MEMLILRRKKNRDDERTAWMKAIQNKEVAKVLADMAGIVLSTNATEDEREAAKSTIQEALYPTEPRDL